MRIGRHQHRFRLRVVTILDHRQIAPQLFDQMNDFCGLLFGQQIDLQTETLLPLLKSREPLLANENHGRNQQGTETDNPFQP